MSNIVLIQSSLSKGSKTSLLIDETVKVLKEKNIDFEVIDLRKIEMQFCDGRKIEEYNLDLQKAYKLIKSAKGYIIGMPVYCYSLSGVLKNFLDITCSAMEGKVTGIICSAGGAMSYLASADLMKILSYEVHVLSVQPTVYASGGDFENGMIKNEKVLKKISDMVENLTKKIG